MLKHDIAKLIEQALTSMDITDVKIQVDYPSDPSHGDYASNVALIAAKKVGKSPMEFAEELVKALGIRDEELGFFEKIEVAKPGFINFTMHHEQFLRSESSPEQKGVYAGKKVIVEFTDPNPFKEFHIGHLYSNIVGESLSRLLAATGAEVKRADYFGDVGMHVAKTLWGLTEKFQAENAQFTSMEELGRESLPDRIKFLGAAYALGATAYEDLPQAKETIQMINKHVYLAAQKMWQEEKGIEPKVDYRQGASIHEETLQHILETYRLGRAWSMEYFETIFDRLGTKFDFYFPESIAGERGYQLVRDNQEKGIFEESEGAVVFPESVSGLHTRVFINKLGLPTYEAKELGLAPWKYEEYPYDLSIIVTGNEINEYFKVLLTALKKINPELGEKTKHISHGMVKLPEGKMSSRTGKILTGEWLMNEAKDRAKTLSESEETAEQVGLGAIKYALLKNSIGKDVEFNFEESVSFDGNSGPYLQYTFARTQSVLEKAGYDQTDTEVLDSARTITIEERNVLRLLARFDEHVLDAATRLSPSTVATYLFDLAQAFNGFYQKCPIIKADNETKAFRLALTSLTGKTIKQGLYLLGIQAPDKM